ncbi:MAG TPA: hypothetical protein VG323_15070, partial [Thermoanaerobaculia bacterium]|nr:hypothetical protein [Thermoanaerobaculia bacterium]
VISYAPYSDRLCMPAVQSRGARHFALVEFPQNGNYTYGQVVLYDTKGLEEPRVLYPTTGGYATIYAAAVREDDQQLAIFVQAGYNGGTVSVDGGNTWKTFLLSSNPLMNPTTTRTDAGGPYVRGRYSLIRIGSRDVPFILDQYGAAFGVFATGKIDQLVYARPIGTSRDGTQLLVLAGLTLGIVDLKPGLPTHFVGNLPYSTAEYDGWITPDGGAYVELRAADYDIDLYYVKGTATFVNGTTDHSPPTSFPPPPLNYKYTVFYAIPSSDYSGAWMIGRSRSTSLFFHSPATGLVNEWTDNSGPEVEAIFAGNSGKTVLVQVHRPRVTLDQSLFKDPALAVWHLGDPAPASYDELFLAETPAKAFVHVDPDAVESGEPFVFDSGINAPSGGGGIISPAPPAAGGSDVTQEWGVVHASLAQRLVLPGAARTAGAFGSFWTTDVTFYNPSDASVNVSVRYAPNGGGVTFAEAQQTTLTLRPREIRLVNDVLHALFGLDSGGGALYITPETGAAINVASRTYSQSDKGTFGFGMNAIDIFAAIGPRFPATFSGAVLGANFRTNLVLTDVSGRATEAAVTAWLPLGANRQASFSAPLLGQQQVNFVNQELSIPAEMTAALVVQPTRGEAVATAFAIDNRTNDATYFPPDISASVVRILPAVGHVDGANGAQYRTDIFLFNNSADQKLVNLQATLWTGAPLAAQTYTLKPHEVRVIPDALFTLFGRSGVARMRVWSTGAANDPAVRATARIYTTDANGGTYGFLMPPLNSFQSGAAGDTLEILGASLQARFRTNVGLVDTTRCDACGVKSHARIDIVGDGGAVIDSFETDVPAAGGMQMNDLLHGRGLPDTNAPVIIRITVMSGMIGAYAAVVDNGTNDPAYFAANLAAKQ